MNIHYIAPSNREIEHVARLLCAELGKREPAFNSPDVSNGLADYLKIVFAIQTRIANTDDLKRAA